MESHVKGGKLSDVEVHKDVLRKLSFFLSFFFKVTGQTFWKQTDDVTDRLPEILAEAVCQVIEVSQWFGSSESPNRCRES